MKTSSRFLSRSAILERDLAMGGSGLSVCLSVRHMLVIAPKLTVVWSRRFQRRV